MFQLDKAELEPLSMPCGWRPRLSPGRSRDEFTGRPGLTLPDMPESPPEALAQYGVFTRDQALASGWTRGSLDHALRVGNLFRLRRGVYAPAELLAASETGHLAQPHFADGVDPRLDPGGAERRHAARAAAGVLGEAGSVASHRSAAVLAGLPVLPVPQLPCLTIASRRHGTIRDVHLHRATLDARDLASSDGILRTGAARTCVDIARELGVEAAVVTADAALRLRRTTAQNLDRVLAGCANWPGIAHAATAVRRADALSESPLESVSRLAIDDAGLPRPELQANIYGPDGTWLARSDFFWRRSGVVGEADGMSKYDSPTALRAEKLRQERLERVGLIVVRWGWADLANRGHLADRIRHALARGHAAAANWSWRAA